MQSEDTPFNSETIETGNRLSVEEAQQKKLKTLIEWNLIQYIEEGYEKSLTTGTVFLDLSAA